MSRARASPSPGEPEKSAGPIFVPPPIQRLSRTFSGSPHSPSLHTSNLPSQACPAPLRGPNRAPGTIDHSPHPSCSKPSNIFPRLHRLEIADDMSTTYKKPPLLDLKLSSLSFLDAVATDADSDKPLYAVETVGSTTTIWRADPWDGSAKIADIRWPKDLPLKGKGRDNNTQAATVQMDGLHWRDAASLLKYSGLGSSRKFYVPYHQHALKWKRERNVYVCTTSTCKGVVATLDSFADTDASPRLKVFESLASFHHSVPRLDHAGISLSLLDHLFVTALLLVTESDDWMILTRNPSALDNRPADAPFSFRSSSATRASARQWRKVMYGEPMYPSLKTPGLDKGIGNACEDADVFDTSDPPQLSTSARQWRKIVYGEPLYPSLRSQSTDAFDLPPRPSTATSFSSESAYSPPTPSSAPSTGFYDPLSLFDDTDRATSHTSIGPRRVSSPLALSSGTLSPMPSSECIPLSAFPIPVPPGARRELPSPPSSYQPPPSVQPWLHRSRSSPKLSQSAQSPIPFVDDPEDLILPSQTLLTRISNVRQLPTPPLRESPIRSPQAQMRPQEAKRLSQAPQRSLPPTPGSIGRSPSGMEQHHGHSMSQVVASPTPPIPTMVRPSTAQPGPSTGTQSDARSRRTRIEKNPDEVLDWMRNVTRVHRRRAVDGDDEDPACGPDDANYEAPPPAYNAIDFSTPSHAISPPRGTES